jgi:hypothetical protein
MYHRDSPTEREEERRRRPAARERAASGSVDTGKSKDVIRADDELNAETIFRPGGFRNDPNDPANPNEARERYLRRLRSLTRGTMIGMDVP